MRAGGAGGESDHVAGTRADRIRVELGGRGGAADADLVDARAGWQLCDDVAELEDRRALGQARPVAGGEGARNAEKNERAPRSEAPRGEHAGQAHPPWLIA